MRQFWPVIVRTVRVYSDGSQVEGAQEGTVRVYCAADSRELAESAVKDYLYDLSPEARVYSAPGKPLRQLRQVLLPARWIGDDYDAAGLAPVAKVPAGKLTVFAPAAVV